MSETISQRISIPSGAVESGVVNHDKLVDKLDVLDTVGKSGDTQGKQNGKTR